MSKLTLKASKDQLAELVTLAAGDRNFMMRLLANPKGAANSVGIELMNDDVAEVSKVFDDLTRFGGNTEMHPMDAKNWAVGTILVRRVLHLGHPDIVK